MLPQNPAPHPPSESEDLTLGKRKASQITADPQAIPSVSQKRKKRRKVESNQSISVANNSTITVEPPEPDGEPGVVPGNTILNASSISAGTSTKKKKRKPAGVSQSDSTHADPAGRRVEPPIEPASTPKLPPAEPSRTGKRKKTVVLDLSTVIPSPAAAQVRPDPSVCRNVNSWNIPYRSLYLHQLPSHPHL